jgi:hypothetical protein
MQCEMCDPNIQNRFNIFRMKVGIEQSLNFQNNKNIQTLGNIDVKQVYQYEKLFQKYALHEYITANSAMNFWRELLSKNINATSIQLRGSDISRNYSKI